MTPDDSAMLRELGLVAKRYTAVMDRETCPSCRSLHGKLLALEDMSVAAPNPGCTCERGCDCMWLYLTAEEATREPPPGEDRAAR